MYGSSLVGCNIIFRFQNRSSFKKLRILRENYDWISLVFPKGEKVAIREAARKEGVSMSEYILAAVDEKMGRINKEAEKR